jgi:hypothetical protein
MPDSQKKTSSQAAPRHFRYFQVPFPQLRMNVKPPGGIGLSAMASPEGSDFLLWPLPEDRTSAMPSPPGDKTFCCGPSPESQLPNRSFVCKNISESMRLP